MTIRGMNIINPAGLMNTDNQSAPLFDMLGRLSGGQKNVENVGRKSVAFYNKLFFPAGTASIQDLSSFQVI